MTSDFVKQMFSLEGMTAIVTGATGGLGSAMVTALAKAGASIVSFELPNDPLSPAFKQAIEATGAKIQVFQCDLKDSSSLRACYQSAWDAGIVPDILLNCAGIQRRNLCENTTDEDIDMVSLRQPSTEHQCLTESTYRY